MKKDILSQPPVTHDLKKSKKMGKDGLKDVEMTDAENKTATEEEPKKDADLLTLEDIREHVRHIEKAVSTKEPRFMSRALRALVSLRRKLNHNVLRRAILGYFPAASLNKDGLLVFLEESMETDNNIVAFRPRTGKAALAPLLPEVELYLHLLLLLFLIDNKRHTEAVKCADNLMDKVTSFNRRTVDMLAAKCYFYYARIYELTDQLDKTRLFLHARLRTATLRNDFEGQAVILNLLLRNYLHYNLYDQADKLVSKSTFPENATNNELARFLYYTGRIKAIQLEYSAAQKNLLQAIRKAPQHSAVGFKQTIKKCDTNSCDYCTQHPLRGEPVSWLPDPEPATDGHYKEFLELFGQSTTDKHRPSANEDGITPQQQEADKENKSILVTVKVRSCLKCGDCSKPRCVYSPTKLSPQQQSMLEDIKSGASYTCGDELDDPQMVVRQALSCSSPMEVSYFSASLAFGDVCFHCGTERNLLDTQHEYIKDLQAKHAVVRPICSSCHSAGRAAKVWGSNFKRRH